MHVPADRKYTEEHEWVAPDPDGALRVGITDYAQDALGDVVFVDLPKVDAHYAGGDSVAEIESTKSVAEVYTPLAGTVAAVNERLNDSPELINSSPYGDGWIFAITPDDDGWQEGLLDAAAYEALIED
jgi:glycine cleavage system H protein